MQIHHDIIEVYPEKCLIVVRFYTDVVTKQKAMTTPNATDSNDEPARCWSDRAIQLPTPVPSGEALEKLIMTACPLMELEIEERRILNETNPDPLFIESQAAIAALLGTKSTISV